MDLSELAARIGAELLTPAPSPEVNIEGVYAGDRMSDLLSGVTDSTLLVTHIANKGLVRLIELMDVPGICLAAGSAPDDAVLETARECGTALMVSPEGMFETCGRLYVALFPGSPGHTAS